MKDRLKKTGDIMEIYATLVGRIDSAITIMEGMIERQSFDWFHMIQATEMLKAALLEAEEAYIEAAEEMLKAALLSFSFKMANSKLYLANFPPRRIRRSKHL